MPQITRILCPVDFSDFSRHAVDYALAVAHWYGGAITALHVVPPPAAVQPIAPAPLYPPIVFTPDDLEQFRRETAMFVEAESGRAPIEAIVVEGDPGERDCSNREGAVGGYARDGYARPDWLRTVAPGISHRTSAPEGSVSGPDGPVLEYPTRCRPGRRCSNEFCARSTSRHPH